MTYVRFNAASLPCNVGKDAPDGSRLSDGRSGCISYGPYFRGEPGSYIAGFHVRRTGQAFEHPLTMDVLVGGERQLVDIQVFHRDLFDDIPKLVYVTFDLYEPTDAIEVRLHVDASASIEVLSLVIFSTPPRNWGGL